MALLEETNASGAAQADYIYLNGRPIATLDPATGALYFLNDDLLGTPQVATDSSQNIQWQATYQPFGTASVSGTLTQNLRFPGQYFDAESGWNHNGFRNYIPDLGRYAEPDPLGRLGSGNNLYVYVDDDPIDFVDPLGLECRCEPKNEKLKYRSVRGNQHSNPWEIKWSLTHNAVSGGWIVQHIVADFEGAGHYDYWEAWPVAPNTHTPSIQGVDENGNFYSDKFSGHRGSHIHASARFYECLHLPDSFTVHPLGFPAGVLRSTTVNPNLPTGNATAPNVRWWGVP